MHSPVTTLLLLLSATLSFTNACCANAFNLTALSLTAYTASNITTNSTSYMLALNNTINFTVRDPDPATQSYTTCSAAWPAALSTPPTAYVACAPSKSFVNGSANTADSAFSWRFGDDGGAVPVWDGPRRFGLSVAHSYRDDSLGPPPWNRRSTFGRAELNQTFMNCVAMNISAGLQMTRCALKGPAVDMSIFAEA